MLLEFTGWLTYLFHSLPYKDLVEIVFFSAVIYYLLLWLRQDTEKNLLLSFYAYCFLFFVAHYADLPVMRFTLFMTAPVVALIFIIIHQQTLQKNFVNLAKVTPSAFETNHWLDELIKCCLMALNRHREIVLVIERNDHLKSLIHAPYFIYAELKKDVFDILLEKHIPGNDYMIWINQQGKLVAINCSWRTQLDETWISKEAQNMHIWKQNALFITSKTDALMFKVNPLTRSFDLVISGKILEGISAEQASSFLKKHFAQPKPVVDRTILDRAVADPMVADRAQNDVRGTSKEKTTAHQKKQSPSEKVL